MEVITIDIDIAKRIFQIHGIDKNGKTILKCRSQDLILQTP
ncbi:MULTISPECIES: hypothetical protein [unclassified Candidatus Tisiphia]